jgi:hypothetical protein
MPETTDSVGLHIAKNFNAGLGMAGEHLPTACIAILATRIDDALEDREKETWKHIAEWLLSNCKDHRAKAEIHEETADSLQALSDKAFAYDPSIPF